jgi:hypothetical protein
MTKVLIRSLLSLSILLIGHGLYAHTYSVGAACSSSVVSEELEQVSTAGQDSEIHGLFTFASRERQVLKPHVREVRENEEDEHESRSFKKNIVSNKYFAAVFCGQIMARYFKQILPFCYRRHLVVKVFRL